MKKISLIITGALLALASNLTLAATEQNTKWYNNISANVAVDLDTEYEVNDNDSVDLDKGLSLGADYNLKLKHLDIVLGGKYFTGRDRDVNLVIYESQYNNKTKFSGLVLDASIKKSWSVYKHTIYALAGVNVAAHLDMDSSTTNIGTGETTDPKYKTKADGVGFQVGVGYQINKQFSVELVQEELKSKFASKDTDETEYSDYRDIAITATSLAVNYSF